MARIDPVELERTIDVIRRIAETVKIEERRYLSTEELRMYTEHIPLKYKDLFNKYQDFLTVKK